MTKKFKAKHMEKLDNPMRRKALPPDEVINTLNINKDQHVADVGCGIGYFTIPMAKVVGEGGKVYAIDINPDMLEETRKRVEKEGYTNVEIVHSSENNFKIPDSSVDVIFTATVFHELNEPEIFLNECKRVLKTEGRLVVLDWNKINEKIGPPIHTRKDVESVKDCLTENSFNIKDTNFIGNSFYVVSCTYK